MSNKISWQITCIWRRCNARWEAICSQCGKCCYRRHVKKDGTVVIYYNRPCKFLDEKTHLCKVYDDRFEKNACCQKMSLWIALFNRTVPETCAYARKFRIWKRCLRKSKMQCGHGMK